MNEGKFIAGIVIGLLVGVLLLGGRQTTHYGTLGIGMGDPCYYPTQKQPDGSCK